jgi:3-methyl-2-oxobutanoate hydroxymethyltransferase
MSEMTSAGAPREERVTPALIREKKRRGEPIVMLTGYDFLSAQVADRAGVDITLVGDSGAMVMLGYQSTRDVSVDEMLVLARAARRGTTRSLLLGDLPYGSYEGSDELALSTARRFIEAGCEAVKIEGAGPIADRARALVNAGIPVVGHVGLTPQTLEYRVQGRTADRAVEIARDAAELERAGCFALVFEAIPAPLAALIMPRLTIPVIGIGAGNATDGQVLVFHDLLGLYDQRTPRFVKRYAAMKREMIDAVRAWRDDVRARRYPGAEHTYPMDEAELRRAKEALG